VLGAGAAAVGLALAGGADVAMLPFGNPNHLASWLLLPGAIAVVALLWSDVRRRGARESAFLWFGLVGIIGAGLAASGSRGAGLAAAAALSAVLGFRRLGVGLGVKLAAGALAITATALFLGPLLAPDGLAPSADGNESSAGLRWALYAASARGGVAALPLGVGPGGFGAAFEVWRPAGLSYSPQFAHNEILQGLVELGLPFVLALVATGLLAMRRLKSSLDADSSAVTWGAATAVLALLAHSLVDFPLHVPAIALTGAALAGVVYAGGNGSGPLRSVVATRIALAGLSCLVLAGSGTRALAGLAEARADESMASGQFERALHAAELGLRARPARAGLWTRLADAAEHAHRFGGAGPDQLALALAARDRAAAASPARASLWLAAARSRLRARDFAGAHRELDRAEERSPWSPVLPLARARLHLHEGARDEAAAELRRVAERHPRGGVPALTAFLRDTADPELVKSAFPASPEGQRAAGRVLARAGFLGEAARALASSFEAAPEDARVGLDAGRYFLRVGEPVAAADILQRTREHFPADERVLRVLRALQGTFAGREVPAVGAAP